MKSIIEKVLTPKNLSKKEAYEAMRVIMSGEATPVQVAGFLVALRAKGETIPEIAGCALAMRDAAVHLASKGNLTLDCCGTGGDGQQSFNISTAVSFVVAGAGFSVAKHGNRSISSKSGSADVLEALGVNIQAEKALVETGLNEDGLCFMFAPSFHPAMKFAAPARKELAIRTIFNILGPLTNPARANVQMIGVFKEELAPVIAQTLKEMKQKAGLVVHADGWDEIILDRPVQALEVFNGKVKKMTLTHKDFGLPKVSSRHLKGGTASENAETLKTILSGEKIPVRDVVLANAGALLWLAERVRSKKKFSLKDGVEKARQSIDEGRAAEKLSALIRRSTGSAR